MMVSGAAQVRRSRPTRPRWGMLTPSVVWRRWLNAASRAHLPLPATRLAQSQPPIAGAAQGSVAGASEFEPFVRAHERVILNYLWRMLGDEESAHDLTQEVFLRAWRNFAKLQDYEQPRAWLLHVATNLAVSHRRWSIVRAGVTSLGEREAADADPRSDDPIRELAESDQVRQTLLALPPKRRAALVLREVYGYSGAEVAQALGIAESAVYMLLSRARAQFRALYSQEEEQS